MWGARSHVSTIIPPSTHIHINTKLRTCGARSRPGWGGARGPRRRIGRARGSRRAPDRSRAPTCFSFFGGEWRREGWRLMGFGVGERREDWCIVVVEINLSIERYAQHTYPRWHAGARWGEEVVGEEVIDIVADAPPRRHLPGLFCLRGCWGCWVGVWVVLREARGSDRMDNGYTHTQ